MHFIWVNSYFAFGSFDRFKPRNIEIRNLIVYLIIIMLLYLGHYCFIVFLCWRQIPLWNLSRFLLCVWKLCKVQASKHRNSQLNCLFNNYKVVIPRSLLFYSISMFQTNIEFCNLIVYLIIIMLLYLGLYSFIVFFCWRQTLFWNLSQFLLCVWKLCKV